MQLTRFTDFGLRALMRMAAEPSQTFTTSELATAFKISRHHLTKIVRNLAAAGLVIARRGVGGGVKLARSPQEIRIGEVVRLLENGRPIVECFRADGGVCTLTARCRLKSRLARAREAFMKELDATTLAQCAYPGVIAEAG
jgi:Rrf2 family nitric oxide-sensitive transcriptional repressor